MSCTNRASYSPWPLLLAGLLLWVAALVGLSGLISTEARAQNRSTARPPLARAEARPEARIDSAVQDARNAARRRDRTALAAARASLEAAQHPLMPWVDYWDLGSRLREATVDEVEAFYQRWPGTYVEDRLRNDWLLELGRRRDFAAIARDYPRFRMDDDREVRCWWLLTEHLAGRDVREAARQAWLAQRDLDDGCNMLATAMVDAQRLRPDDVWLKARLALEQRRVNAVRAAVGLLGESWARQVGEALDNPARFLRRETGGSRGEQELRTLALMRLATTDTAAASAAWPEARLSPALASWTGAYIGRQAAFNLAPEAAVLFQRAAALQRDPLAWSDETLAWGVRSALRGLPTDTRWPLVLRLVAAMDDGTRLQPAWQYWQAQALLGSAGAGASGEAQRQQARRQLASLADPLHFYGLLAADTLGTPPAWPLPPPPTTAAERAAAAQHAGLQRALQLMDLGLRSEGRREWNFHLREMDDRQLRAAAAIACDRSDWQLCINTAERTRNEVDLALRYPMPWQAQIREASAKAGLEPALVFGLIRQETRFMPQLRSHVGASGLMQVMPDTARLVARRLGLRCCTTAELHDLDTNLMLGTQYLRWALDGLDGSQALAAAAYNAGPGRPKRWREGATMDAAAWTEHVPFDETRDYVQKVLANAAVYAALPTGSAPTLRPRLGQTIGPSASPSNSASSSASSADPLPGTAGNQAGNTAGTEGGADGPAGDRGSAAPGGGAGGGRENPRTTP